MPGFILYAALMLFVSMALLLPSLLKKNFIKKAGQIPSNAVPYPLELNIEVLHDQMRELEYDLRNGMLTKPAYQQARKELEFQLGFQPSSDPASVVQSANSDARKIWSALLIAFSFPVVAGILYARIGYPDAMLESIVLQDQPQGQEANSAQIREMVERLAKRLETNTDDVAGWSMLARSYENLGHLELAAEAYHHVQLLRPNDPDALTDYAVALALLADHKLAGAPEALIRQALKIDPQHEQALALAGSVAMERREYERAVSYWQALLVELPADASLTKTIRANIAQANALANHP